jgi:hypothetical protein
MIAESCIGGCKFKPNFARTKNERRQKWVKADSFDQHSYGGIGPQRRRNKECGDPAGAIQNGQSEAVPRFGRSSPLSRHSTSWDARSDDPQPPVGPPFRDKRLCKVRNRGRRRHLASLPCSSHEPTPSAWPWPEVCEIPPAECVRLGKRPRDTPRHSPPLPRIWRDQPRDAACQRAGCRCRADWRNVERR